MPSTHESQDPAYWIEKSFALRESGQLDAAIEACRRALALAPQDAGALSSLAHALRGQGRYAEAADAARKATDVAPHLPVAWFNYAASLAGLERPAEAIVAYRQALEKKPDYAEAWSNLGNALADLKRDDEALEAHRQAARHKPDLAPIWSNLGDALWRAGHANDALAACQRAVTLDPRFEVGWLNLGMMLRDLGRLDEATGALARAVELNSNLTEGWKGLGSVREMEGRLVEAEQAYRKALAADKPSAAVLARLGTVLRQQGRLADSVEHLKQALALDPDHLPSLAEIGQIFSESGETRHEAAHYRRAVEVLLRAVQAGDVESALDFEDRIYQAFVQTRESEAHYERCFADWSSEFAALGRRYCDTTAPDRCDVRRVAFVLLGGHILGHTEVLFRMLEDRRSLPEGAVVRLYVMRDYDDEFAAKAKAAGVETVFAESVLPRRARTSALERLQWLRAHLKQDGFCTAIWVSTPVWATFALSMRLAPVQIFWALRFHPLAGPHIDGYLTGFGSRHETERRYGRQRWTVCPAPLAVNVRPAADPAAARAARARFPQRILFGTVARENKINSKPYLECVAHLLRAHPDAGYVWTGRTQPAEIVAFFQASGVADRCHFAGWVDVNSFVNVFDVFLETFPLGGGVSGYYALANGIPLVSYLSPYTVFGSLRWGQATGDGDAAAAADTPGSPAGIHCAGSADEYVGLATRLVMDPDFRAAFGSAGRAFYENEARQAGQDTRRFFDAVRAIAVAKIDADGTVK